jgi:hypothetical protein
VQPLRLQPQFACQLDDLRIIANARRMPLQHGEQGDDG